MKRREFIKTAAGVSVAAAFSCSPAGPKLKPPPNLLVIYTDQQSLWTISAFGGTEVHTPHIDSIAAEGVRFSNYFANHAVCTASRGCFLTGRYPHAHGAWKNDIPINRDEITFARLLRGRGYETGYAGKWHLDGGAMPGWVPRERSMGFTDCRYMFNGGHWKKIIDQEEGPPSVFPVKVVGNKKSYTTDWLTARAVEFIEKKRSSPFCFMVSFPDPHPLYTVRAPYNTMFKPGEVKLPPTLHQKNEDKPDWARYDRKLTARTPGKREHWIRKKKAQYCGMVKCIDDNVGKILAALRRSGQWENTVVVFTTDHGDFMGEHGLAHKGRPYETVYHLPLLMQWPGGLAKGKTVGNIVGTVDIMPTILGLMGVAGSGREQGRDASALVRGESVPWKDEAFIHRKAGGGILGIWTPGYELVYVKNMDAALFDRVNDPLQVTNLFSHPGYKRVVARLTDRIIAHTEAVGDPEVEWLKQMTRLKGNTL